MRKSYRTAITAELEAAKAIATAAETEDRELTDVEQDTIQGHVEKAQALEKSAKRETGLFADLNELTKGLGVGETQDPGVGIAPPNTPASETARRVAKSTGARFVESDEYKALLATAPDGMFGKSRRVQSSPVRYKDLFTGADHDESAGALVRPDYRGLLDPFYERPLTIRSLVASGNTTSDSLEYVRLVSVTNNAAVVPEATSTAPIGDGTGGTVLGPAGGLKPESGFVFEKDSTTVKTIAHWIPATKRALSDAAQIRTMIDSFLRYGLEEELETELITGDGTGEHFLGLNSTPGIQTQAAPAGAQTNHDILRIARRKVQIGGRARPTAYVMNPIDWEKIELMRDGNENFYGAGPFALTTPRVWGLPIVESEAVAAGTAWVADWNYAVLYDREQASIQATDAHADFFVRNLVAILAEMRAAFAVLRPAAFVKITLGA